MNWNAETTLVRKIKKTMTLGGYALNLVLAATFVTVLWNAKDKIVLVAEAAGSKEGKEAKEAIRIVKEQIVEDKKRQAERDEWLAKIVEAQRQEGYQARLDAQAMFQTMYSGRSPSRIYKPIPPPVPIPRPTETDGGVH